MSTIIALLVIVSFMALAEGSARAQQPKKIPLVGWISLLGRNSPNTSVFVGRKGPNITAFMEGLRERGYIEGQNIIIEYRSGEGSEDRLSEIATDLVRLKVDVIIADTNAATRAAKKATTTIPVIFIYGDPVWDGLVASVEKPGGNLTGLSILAPQMAGKRLELLRDTLPKISRVAVLLDPDASVHRGQFTELQPRAQALKVQLQALELRDSHLDFERLFQQAINQRADAVLTLPNPTVTAHRRRMLDFVARSRLPAMYPDGRFTDEGGLMSYGPSLPDLYRRAAFYVDKILKGAKPAELPAEQPAKSELVINLKTAKTLGVTIPSRVLMWADRVISDSGQMPEKSVATTYPRDAQRSAKIPRLGVLSVAKPGVRHAFKQQLSELGWVEGQNIAFEYRGAEGNEDRLPALAAELLRMNVDIIVTTSTRGALAARRLTKTTPIVTTAIPGPGDSGLVESLYRPGRNVTGLSFMRPELSGKRLELLKEIIPGLSRIAVLSNVANVKAIQITEIESVARSLSVQLQIVNVKRPDEIATAFSSMVREKVGALSVLTQSMLVLNRKRIVALAAKNRLPAMYPDSGFTYAGGLVSYGPNYADLYRRAAIYVDKILRGAKPADLPVEQPTKFELVINLKTAEHIGLTIPPNVLMWADRVIK